MTENFSIIPRPGRDSDSRKEALRGLGLPTIFEVAYSIVAAESRRARRVNR